MFEENKLHFPWRRWKKQRFAGQRKEKIHHILVRLQSPNTRSLWVGGIDGGPTATLAIFFTATASSSLYPQERLHENVLLRWYALQHLLNWSLYALKPGSRRDAADGRSDPLRLQQYSISRYLKSPSGSIWINFIPCWINSIPTVNTPDLHRVFHHENQNEPLRSFASARVQLKPTAPN